MSSIDVQFIEFVVKSLVNNPDAVKIDRRIDEKGVLLELTVDPEDLGRVIGKRGATAQSIRTLLRALGTKNDARYNLKIIDNGTYEPRQRSEEAPTTTPDEHETPSENAPSEQPMASESEEPADNGSETDTPAEAEPQTESAPEPESDTSDRISKARAELEELDDLDV